MCSKNVSEGVYTNQDIADIVNSLKEGQLVFLIGAGCSEELGYPSSSEFASKLASRFLVSAGSQPDLDSVVCAIFQGKNQAEKEELDDQIRDFIVATFNEVYFARRRPEAASGLNPYLQLALILKKMNFRDAVIVTTNWDTELEDALRSTGLNCKPYRMPDDYKKTARKNVIKIYNIHGDVSKKESLVFTRIEWDKRKEALYTDTRSAFQNNKVLIMGHSGRDPDTKEIYDRFRQDTGRTDPAYAIVKEEITPLSDVKLLDTKYSSSPTTEFLQHLAVAVGAPLTPEDLGTKIKLDDQLRRAIDELKKRKSQRKVLVVVGERFSGKSLAIKRVKGDPAYKDYEHAIALPLYDDPNHFAEIHGILKGEKEGKYIVEATPYALEYIENEWFKESPELLQRKNLANHLYVSIVQHVYEKLPVPLREKWESFDKRIQQPTTPSTDIRFKPPGVVHALDRADAESLCEYYSEKLKMQAPKNETEKDSILAFASVPQKGPDDRLYVASLVGAAIMQYAQKGPSSIKDRGELESKIFAHLSAFFGLSLFSGSLKKEIVSGLPAFLDALSGAVSAAVVPVGSILLSFSALLGFIWEKRNAGFRRFMEVYVEWNELQDKKRQILCNSLDEKYRLAPGSSYTFLSGWLSRRENVEPAGIQKVIDFEMVDEVGSTIKKLQQEYPDLRAQIDLAKKELAGHEERLHTLETWKQVMEAWKDEMDRWKSELDSWRHQLENELKETKIHFEEKSARLEATVERNQTPATRLSESNLDSELRLTPALTDPVLNDSLLAKIERIKAYLKEGKNVVLLGEGGIGKSTLLKRICLDLLQEGRPLFTYGFKAIPEGSIFVVDDLTAKESSPERICQLRNAVLVTARTSEWIEFMRNRRWAQEIHLTKDDHNSEELHEILRLMLEAKRMAYTLEGVDVAVRKCDRIPEYLHSLVVYLSLRREAKLDLAAATTIPPGVLALIAEIIGCPKNELSVAVLYSVALTHGRRLHWIQLKGLQRALVIYIGRKCARDTAAEEVETVLFQKDQLFYLSHDLWQTVLLDDWHTLKVNAKEPPPLMRARSLNPEVIADVISKSKKELGRLNESEASKAAVVILENSSLLTSMRLRDWLKNWKVGQVAVVCGPEGVGKSTLIEDAVKALGLNSFWMSDTLAGFGMYPSLSLDHLRRSLAGGEIMKKLELVEGTLVKPSDACAEVWTRVEPLTVVVLDTYGLGMPGSKEMLLGLLDIEHEFEVPIIVESRFSPAVESAPKDAMELFPVTKLPEDVFRYARPDLVGTGLLPIKLPPEVVKGMKSTIGPLNCPSCGGPLLFSVHSQLIRCPKEDKYYTT